MFSTQDATLVRCLGAPPLVAVKSAIVNGRSVSHFSVRPFRIRLVEGVPTARGIGRHPSMPSAWIGLRFSNLLASTANSFTDVTVKSNRTGNIPRQLRGIVCSPLYAPINVARFVHPYSTVYSSDAVRYKQFAGIGFTPLYATLTRLEPSFSTTARSLHRGAAIF